MEELVKAVVDLGLPAVLLLLLVRYFMKMDTARARQVDELYAQFAADSTRREEEHHQDMEQLKEEYKEREMLLTEESARREEILQTEAEKREAALMHTIEEFSRTMQQIAEAMNEIKNTTTWVQEKIGAIEAVLEDWKDEN